ncbi:MAG: hypothetical protein IJT94_07960, partial [Oscillibacter sp.]|nr:hypothetical protein [Oscillibacter sp.]
SVQEAFLKEFRDDDWYGGFTEYLNAIEHYLSGAADDVDREAGEDWNYYGDYVPDYAEDEGGGLLGVLIVIGIPVLISLLISLGMLGMMKTVHAGAEADSYLKGELNLRVKEDIYTHTTESRVKIKTEKSDSGGSSGGGGGGSFSGGGKF